MREYLAAIDQGTTGAFSLSPAGERVGVRRRPAHGALWCTPV